MEEWAGKVRDVLRDSEGETTRNGDGREVRLYVVQKVKES
jgi:hypothetical protein